VPSKIIQISDIPKTISGKIVEIAVKKVVEGLAINNTEALANPEALDLFKNIPALQED
jgi:acetoacetyl-CoA synthetase